MTLGCSSKDLHFLQLLAGSLLLFAIGCGAGAVGPSSTSLAQNPTTTSTTPGSSSAGSTSNSGSSGSGSSTGNGSSTHDPSAPSPTSSFLYLGVNNGSSRWSSTYNDGAGAIAGFSIASDGSLQPTPGSPYAGPSGSLATNSAAATLYSAFQTTLNVDRINTDGSLTTAATFNSQPLTPSPGFYEDLSFDPSAQLVYALAIHGAGDNFFEIYKSGSDGSLTGAGSQQATVAIGHVSFTPTGTYAYQPYCYHLDQEILAYKSAGNGQIVSSSSKAQLPKLGGQYSACPSSLSITRDGSRLVAQLNSFDGTAAAIVVYAIDANGTLTPQGLPSPTTAQGSDIAVDASGRYAAVAAKDGLWVYDLSGSIAASVGGTAIAVGQMDHVAFNKAGTLLFATSTGSQALYVFAFDATSGTITAAPGSPHALNFPPYEVALSER